MAFVRQQHEAGGAAGALQSLEQPLGLDGERARVAVPLAVDQQDRRADLIGVAERRDLVIDLRRFPEAAPFGLEAERGKGAVVRAAPGDARREEVGVREQVRGHERPVAVAAHRHPRRVDDAHLVKRADMRGRGRGGLLDVGVVHSLRVADHRHGRVLQYRVAAQDEPGRLEGRQPGETLAAARTSQAMFAPRSPAGRPR